MTTDLSCREIEELLPAFVLDALGRDETIAVALHLSDCRQHDADLAELRSVTSSLPAAVEPVAPPPALRGKLLGAFEAERDAGEPEPVLLPSRPPRSVLQRPVFAYGLAASLMLLVAGLAAWALSARDAGDSSIVNAYEVREGDTRLTVLHLPKDSLTIVTGEMSAVPAGRAYQAWLIHKDGTPQSLGLMPASGPAVFNASLENASAVAITIEPAGGSPAPTAEPVVVAALRRK